MKDRYDFSKGKRGRVVPSEPEPECKVHITIRLDQDIVDRFSHWPGPLAARPGIRRSSTPRYDNTLDGKAPKFKDALPRIIREELKSSTA